MFDDVAAGYDVTNNLLSAGNALLWRIATTRAVNPQASERVLDLAAGTGTSSDGKAYSGDSIGITGTPVGTYNSKDVATAANVSITGLTLTNNTLGNYVLTAPTPLAATITPKDLTIKVNDDAQFFTVTSNTVGFNGVSYKGFVTGESSANLTFSNSSAGPRFSSTRRVIAPSSVAASAGAHGSRASTSGSIWRAAPSRARCCLPASAYSGATRATPFARRISFARAPCRKPSTSARANVFAMSLTPKIACMFTDVFVTPFADYEFMRRALVGSLALALSGAPLSACARSAAAAIPRHPFPVKPETMAPFVLHLEVIP